VLHAEDWEWLLLLLLLLPLCQACVLSHYLLL
jgi:hypothetical protein